MSIDEIRKELFALQDIKYRDFQSKLIPSVDPESVIGVRTPELRKMAKKLSKLGDIQEFLDDLPHRYFDENQLQAFIISEIKDYDKCVKELNEFLPFVDNWATCDQMSPKVFKKHKEDLLKEIPKWLKSDKTYTIRF
ncbi:MAG: DNA alkylation repair protein, partial [Lachnospiraceae bacterium]|nr:DNA alkylation repair protein [Lachnospiraceae bacterium]